MNRSILILLVTLLLTTGCALNIYKKSPKDKAQIEQLSSEVSRLNALRANEMKEFEDIKRELQKKLKGKVGLEVVERGLVITLGNNILFDSGKDKIKDDAHAILDQIVDVVKAKAADKNIGIEGHTDNVPITHSGWKSNRELSTARANNVYHYLVDIGGLEPSKLTTMGYGEFRPIATNGTKEGQAKNRRVEIVILPQYPKKTIDELKEENWAK
ncbi:MAG: OmpA family protein [Candidatus Omnitrophota bacterium]